MELILATADGREERRIWDDVDIEIGGENTFEITCPYASWDGLIAQNKRVYVPGTEYGGIVRDIRSATSTDQIHVCGYTWRGYLDHKIIEPPTGSDYKTVSGELNTIIRSLIDGEYDGMIRGSAATTGVTTTYQFDRYVSIEAGLRKMLAVKGYRLSLQYIQTDLSGYVEVSAVPIRNYGDDIELSQDTRLDFTSRDYRMGINHLVCLGTGELKDRVVVHLYVDAAGNISQTKYYDGIDEISTVFENTTAELEDLITTGTDRLEEIKDYKEFTADMKAGTDIDREIGDTITGRDYITGNVVTKPITDKIVTITNGLPSVQYKVEG